MSSDKKEKMYMHLMDTLELIHAENIIIMNSIAKIHLDEESANEIVESTKNWEKRFKQIRTDW